MDGGGMDMGGMPNSTEGIVPLTTQGVDFSNSTDANNFLGDLLDDTVLQVIDNAYATYFWYGIVAFIGCAATVNVFQQLKSRHRIRSAARGVPMPAKPQHPLMKAAATATAITREIAYGQITPVGWARFFMIPPVGTIVVVLAYLTLVLALQFANNNVPGAQYFEALGLRAAWLAVAQIPLLILLVGKYNWIGLLAGVGYERLNVYHRWVSRGLLLLATFHFAFQAGGWDQFPGIFELEWSTDICVPTGLSTYILLIWMNLSTLAPFRNLRYELFVAQHVISFFGFIIALMIHLPTTALYSRVYVYIPIGFYLFDKLIRALWYAYINSKSCNAVLETTDGEMTKVILRGSRLTRWRPGAHVLVSLPSIGVGQNHPATILSTPTSHNGDVVLLLRARNGFTKNIAKKALPSPLAQDEALSGSNYDVSVPETQRRTFRALIDGPFGGQTADFAAFDTACFIAGSTGITFVLALLLDLASRAETSGGKLPLRRVHLTWAVRDTRIVDALLSELSSATRRLSRAGIDVHVVISISQALSVGRDAGSKESVSSSEYDHAQYIVDALGERGRDVVLGKGPADVNTIEAISSASGEDVSTGTSHITVRKGRPLCADVVRVAVEASSAGEAGIAVCGPLGMSVDVRNAVARLSDERAVHKGTGAQGIYLHVEGFSQ